MTPSSIRLRCSEFTTSSLLKNRGPTEQVRATKQLCFAPDAGEGGLDLFLEAGDQFAVGGDQRLLGFDLGDDGLLRGEGWNWDLDLLQILALMP